MADLFKKALVAFISVVAVLALAFLFPYIKKLPLSGQDIFILKNIRLTMFLTAFAVGGILSLCGLVFQTVFDNPLATPYTLGVSAGASFGVVLYVVFFQSYFGLSLSVPAFFGGLVSVGVIFAVASSVKRSSSEIILLSGVALNFFFGSLILFFQYYADQYDTFEITRWLMGGISGGDFASVFFLFLTCFALLWFFLFNSKKLDLFLLGEVLGEAKGLDASAYRLLFIVVCSLAVSVSVAVAGPIGFVGIIIPHLSKKLFGIKHKNALFYSFFLGGISLAVCQAMAVKVLYPAMLPVGVVTAIIGTPVFLYILISKAEK